MCNLKSCAMAMAIASLYASASHAEDPAAATAVLDAVQVTGKRLDAARNQISTDTGSSSYRFSDKDLAALPLGTATPLNQVVLQAPGVVQDSYGQLHVRGDHANLQYRINGVVIPEAMSGFGQSLDTRFADQINILTGALPAQYGNRTAGIVDIRTRGTGFDNGGSVSIMTGSQGHREVGADLSGSKGDWSYFLTGSALQNNLGIENPTAERSALHDQTSQQKGFAYISKLLDADSRVSLMLGSSRGKFQIPNVPGQTPAYALDGVASVDSAGLDARQTESNSFQIVSYQASAGDTPDSLESLDYQVSLFHRYTDVHYRPDAVGDLVFNGIAADILRKNEAVGVQADASKRLNDRHTLRIGLNVQHERFGVDNRAMVFPADADGVQIATTPFAIVDNTHLSGISAGAYAQDEWQATKDLVVNYGARFDHVNTVVNEQQLSPRIGLVYDLSPRTRLHAGYARYFTPPPTETIDTTSVARFQNTTNALPSDANTSVRAERSHYVDIGLAHQLTPALSLSVDAYYRKVKNLQDEGQFGNALIYSAFNYAQGRVRGIEFSGNYRRDRLTAYANLSLSRAEGRDIVTGQFNFDPAELAWIANHWVHLDHDQTVSASAGVSYLWGHDTLGADLLYGSGLRKGFANSEHLASYTQVNLSAMRPFALAEFGKFEARVALLNVFDKRYELRDGTGIGVGAPQYGQRREVYVSLMKRF